MSIVLTVKVTAVANRWRHCVPFHRPRNRNQDVHTDSIVLNNRGTGQFSQVAVRRVDRGSQSLYWHIFRYGQNRFKILCKSNLLCSKLPTITGNLSDQLIYVFALCYSWSKEGDYNFFPECCLRYLVCFAHIVRY